MLAIKNLSLSINNKEILKDMNATLRERELVALIGPNGAGKSSLLKALSKILPLNSGTVELDGQNLLSLSTQEIAKIISYMAQFPHSVHLKTKEVLELGRRVFGGTFLGEDDRSIIDKTISKLELSPFLDRNIDTLSGGERQKVYLALSLIQTPKILLLDEPIAHLDPKNRLEILEIVKSETHKNSLITLVVLHDIQSALHYGDKIMMIKDGGLLGIVDKKELTEEHIESLYGVECQVFWIEGHPFVHFGHLHLESRFHHNHLEEKI